MKRLALLMIVMALGMATLACSLFTGSNDKSDGLKFAPETLPEGQVGQAYQAVITVSGQRTPVFQMGVAKESLPPGIIDVYDEETQTYTLTGTPTEAGTYTLTISALCYGTNVSGQSGEKAYSLVIK